MAWPTQLTRLGFGVTGPHANAVVSRSETIALIGEAVRAGVRVFDTGPMYGAGEAERRLGAALGAWSREELFISTKARTWPMPSDRREAVGTPAERVVASLKESLVRLNTPYVDVLFLHGPRAEDLTPELMETLQDLRAAELARHIGVCGRGEEIDATLEQDGYEFLMMPVSQARLEKAAARGVGVFAIESMRAHAAPLKIPRSGADLWYLARAARDRMVGTRAPTGVGVAAALQMPAVCSVIVQTTRRAHLLENAREAGVLA